MPHLNLEQSRTERVSRYEMVVWLGDSENCTLRVKSLLQYMFDSIKPFDAPCDCITYVNQETLIDKVYLVISHPQGHHVAQCLTNHRKVHRIFLRRRNQENVSDVITDSNLILFDNHIDLHTALNQNKRFFGSGRIPKKCSLYQGKPKIFTVKSLGSAIMDLSQDSAAFVWFHLLIELIIKLSPSQTEKDELLRTCEIFTRTNEILPKAVEDFRENYKAEHAVTWYTKPSSVFKLVNKAFRMEDIDYIYLFRSLIRNLHEQIVSLYHGEDSKMYRGALVPTSLLQNFIDNVDQLVSMNWFMSTTRSKDIAFLFSGRGYECPGYRPVIFEFTIQDSIQSKPYAYIEEWTKIDGEEEILFTVCSIWRINAVSEKDDGCWYIYLSNSEVEDQEANTLAAYLMKKMGSTPNILTLAYFLYERGNYDKAEFYCGKIVDELENPTPEERISALNLMGLCRMRKEDPSVALDYFHKAKNLLQKNNSSSETLLGIENLRLQENNRQQVRYPLQMQEILRADRRVTVQSFPPGTVTIPVVLNNIALLHYQMWNLDSAKKSFEEAITRLPESSDLAYTYNNLASVYFSLQQYNEAKTFYHKALSTGLKQFSYDHPFIQKCLSNLRIASK